MYYKRIQKYGKKLAAAILTSAVLLASGVAVHADDTGEYMTQANIQETGVAVDAEAATEPETGEAESSTLDQAEQKDEAAEVETQEEGKTQDVSEEQPESEVQIKEEKQPASESAAVPELNEEAQQPAVQSQEAQIAVQTQTVEAPHPGWNQSGGQTYYLDENMNRLTGWRLLGNVWYYFDDQGVMATGWRWIGGKWYYMNSAGAMQSGWFQDGQTWYYANGSGVMQTGWLNRGGTWYYLTGSGAMAEGWGNIGGTWYYFQPGNGAMQVGWVKDGNIWYYMNGSGAMQRGWLNRGGTWYYLTGSGAMVEGWAYIGSSWYYMVPGNGAMVGAGWHLIDNSWYYMNGSGAMCSNRWIGNYYVGGSGAMLTNTWVGSYWVGADGNWIPNYDPDQNAKWVQDGNTWYYQRTDGSRITNSWKKINGTWYYFAGSGAMLTGWNVVGGSWYFFNGSGAMQTGWGQVDGSWYYFGGDGAMKTGWINDGKKNYYLKPNGVWKNILIGVIGNNEAGAATTAAKVREMGVDAVIVTGGYDPSQYDGIIIPGGGDLDPSRYGQANTGSSNIDNALDDRQIDAVKRSAEAGKPVLGICKGIQLVNVAFGGTLNQNIGGHMGVWHSAHVVAGGWLSGVYSGSVSVLSYHHQSIRDLAPGFQVDMRAGDGTVEAISNSAKRVYGVQFHPEQMNNDTGNRCMKQFVAICTN